MVDYIEHIKKVEITFRHYKNKGVKAFVYHYDKNGGLLKESEYSKEKYSKNIEEAYVEVLNKMHTVLDGEF